MIVVYYISAHGFGHGTRSLEVIEALLRRAPETKVVVRSRLAPGFVRRSTSAAIDLQECDVDSGAFQHDSLTLDAAETARAAARFYQDFAARVAGEAAVLRQLDADVVVGDIPPLAFAAADASGIRSIAISNFTWDWIYEGYREFDRLAATVLPQIRSAYSLASIALRLPFHGGFAPMAAVVRDVPLVARKSPSTRAEARRNAGIPDGDAAPVVLASFGAYGAALPYRAIADQGRFHVVVTEHEMPEADDGGGRLHRVQVAGGTVRYKDLVAAADVVVSKPGYGIVSECIANDAALLYTSRGRFAEYDVFVAEMPGVLRCRAIGQDDLLAGRWTPHLDALLAQPPPERRLAIDGADVAAGVILGEAAAKKQR